MAFCDGAGARDEELLEGCEGALAVQQPVHRTVVRIAPLVAVPSACVPVSVSSRMHLGVRRTGRFVRAEVEIQVHA